MKEDDHLAVQPVHTHTSVASDESHPSLTPYHADSDLSEHHPSPTRLQHSESYSSRDTHSPSPEAASVVADGLASEKEDSSSIKDPKAWRASIVPKHERRGLLATFCVVPEVTDPRDYPSNIKWFLTAVVSLAAMAAPLGTSIMLPGIDDVAEGLNTTKNLVNISFGIYLLSLGVFPIYWSSFSEHFGRRSIYLISFALFTAFSIGCALSTSIGMLIGFRVLSGGAAGSVQSVGAGTISELFEARVRGKGLGIYYVGILVSPLVAPVIGGALVQGLGWRAPQYLLLILGGVLTVAMLFFIPETLRISAEDREMWIRPKNKTKGQKINWWRKKKDLESEIEASGEAEDQEPELKNHHMLSTVVGDDPEPVLFETEDDHRLHPIISHISQMSYGADVSETQSRSRRGSMASSRMKAVGGLELSRVATTESEKYKRMEMPKRINLDELSLGQKMYMFGIAPLKTLLFLRYPPVALAIVYASYVFFSLYILNMAIQIVYSEAPYNFKTIIVGLLYLPNSVGYIAASVGGGMWSDYIVKRAKEKNGGLMIPEERIAENILLAAILFPVSLLIFGWCAQYKTFWLCPLIGTFIFGFASMMIFGTNTTYLVDALPGKGSSGVALNNFVRMILAAVATFVADPMIRGLTVGWCFTLWALLSIVVAFSLVAIKIWGAHWRQTFDLSKIY
ncbi:Quinidine resistance protein 3 [Yarrowia sp. C11]|nr:Quinidine resistance protein 3 [Yarrowia sp. C11]KAG5364953.1 Quinidine resistance protein 3 [Yarrowia sp. E02]